MGRKVGPPPRLHLPFDEWPELDRRLWSEASEKDDPFAEGSGARLAEATLHTRWMAWRRFLGFLKRTTPDELRRSPSERVTPDRVRAYAAHLRETCAPYTVACGIDGLYGAARLLMPEKDWDWLRHMKMRLFAAAPRRKRGPVITSMQLLKLGDELMRESKVEKGSAISLEDAVQYRDGLMIAVAAYIPLRHKNFASIEIGRHLLEEDGRWIITIPPEDSKTKIPIDFELPVELQGPLLVYLKLVRPRLFRDLPSKALWVSAKGGRLSYSAIGPVFTRHTTARLGIRVSPHDARDAAVTLWALHEPGQIGVARDLLGHWKLETTGRHYNRAKGIEASRRQGKLIAKLRRN
jgi:integrase